MKSFGIFLIVLLVVALLIGGLLFSGYNRAIAKDEEVKNRWSQVENMLQRRYDLVDNLVETVKGTAAQEQTVFLGIAEARKAYFQAAQSGDVAQKAQAANVMESALSRLLVLRETYPDLKSNEAFMKLQDSLEGTENRLAVERKNFNDSVRDLNTMVRQFPGSLYARLAGVREAVYFDIPETNKTAPKVDFSPLAPTKKEPG